MDHSELAREKMWSRIHLIPLLQAEEDRDAVRRHYAQQKMEEELLGKATPVYYGDRYVAWLSLSIMDMDIETDLIGLQLREANIRRNARKRDEVAACRRSLRNESYRVPCTYHTTTEFEGVDNHCELSHYQHYFGRP
jgi:hypothetical protein